MAKIISLEEKNQRECSMPAVQREEKAMTNWVAQMTAISTLLDDHFKNEPCPPKYS